MLWKVFAVVSGGLAGSAVLIAGFDADLSGGAGVVLVAGSVLIAVTVGSYIGALKR